MSENSNLPWIHANIDMTFNDNQMLQKMIEVFGNITENKDNLKMVADEIKKLTDYPINVINEFLPRQD